MTAAFSAQLENLVKTRGVQYDLSRMAQALEHLDHPENILGIIHAAGTNGKGTTCDFIAQLLEQQGYTVGLYTSPHLISYTERFQINGVAITDAELQNKLNALSPLISELELTEFEVLTLIAWLYFKEKRTDFVVIETGLGGRLDATVLCSPILTVIATISLDHTDILGPTLTDIAKEKAGILKNGVPCVMLDQDPVVLRTLTKFAKGLSVETTIVPRDKHSYLLTNIGLAQTAVTTLLPNISLPKTLIPRIAGRLEVIRKSPFILADAAHNLEGITMLASILQTRSFCGSIWYGATRRPELKEILGKLLSITNNLTIFEFDHPRAATQKDYPPEVLGDPRIHYVSTKERSTFLEQALSAANNNICLTGSIYFLGEMLPKLRQ